MLIVARSVSISLRLGLSELIAPPVFLIAFGAAATYQIGDSRRQRQKDAEFWQSIDSEPPRRYLYERLTGYGLDLFIALNMAAVAAIVGFLVIVGIVIGIGALLGYTFGG